LASGVRESNSESIFNLPVKSDANFTFALSIPNNSTNLYCGQNRKRDKGLVSIILYPNKRGGNIIISPRLSFREQQPTYSSTIALNVLEGTDDNSKYAMLRLFKRGNWATESSIYVSDLDLRPRSYKRNVQTADLPELRDIRNMRCVYLGSFKIDIKHTTGGIGQLPSTYAISISSTMSDSVTDDSNLPSIFYALCACRALILLMPTSIVFLRLGLKNARWH
ncbi:hypothetical protein N7509_011414, partial [Penicillium cosmopolitanum]